MGQSLLLFSRGPTIPLVSPLLFLSLSLPLFSVYLHFLFLNIYIFSKLLPFSMLSSLLSISPKGRSILFLNPGVGIFLLFFNLVVEVEGNCLLLCMLLKSSFFLLFFWWISLYEESGVVFFELKYLGLSDIWLTLLGILFCDYGGFGFWIWCVDFLGKLERWKVIGFFFIKKGGS